MGGGGAREHRAFKGTAADWGVTGRASQMRPLEPLGMVPPPAAAHTPARAQSGWEPVFLNIAPPKAAPSYDPGLAARPPRAPTWSPHTQLGGSCGSSKRRAEEKHSSVSNWKRFNLT